MMFHSSLLLVEVEAHSDVFLVNGLVLQANKLKSSSYKREMKAKIVNDAIERKADGKLVVAYDKLPSFEEVA